MDAKEAVAPIVDLCYKLNYRKRLPAIYFVATFQEGGGYEEYSRERYLHE
jgi:hypothetical protein